ncbi:alanine racemase [Metabacillus iocasae]|uniref:Alanine racemase n=1 Tax=Priestia iocasae TaxID=2291674 RepID=A0ABS2QXC4_9BACI|nr:alanine racemase [Metabacillus iocasae]MBM7704125.1 alanine racemase [Metabacillus iocasae]
MKTTSYRDTWAEIDVNAIQYNMEQFRAYVTPSTQLMAVVKADGYGHGAIEAAKAAIAGGATYLGVALLDEAIELREAGIDTPILILGYTAPHAIERALEANVTLTVFDHEVADAIIEASQKQGKVANVHLKVDSGMSRVGVRTPNAAYELAAKIHVSSSVKLEGIFTHFAHADSTDFHYTKKQFSVFSSIVDFLKEKDIIIPVKHCCNTAGTMNFKEMHLDMVRVGIGLYGLYPDESLKNHSIVLKQAMSFKTSIAFVKEVEAGQPISYGCTYVPEHTSMIATLPVGYADGLSRLLSNKGYMMTKESKVPIVGRVCMDQTMIDVTNLEHAEVGEEVTIFGYDHHAFQSVDEVASLMGTINYEVVCLIGKRVPRVYKKR